MKNTSVLILTLVACGFGANANSDMKPTAQPSTCYIASSAGAAQLTCLNEKSEPTPLQAVSVSVTDTNTGVLIEKDLSLLVKGAASVEDVYGSYILTLNDPEQKIQVTVGALDSKGLISPVYYRGGGARVGRVGGVGYRGRGGAIVGGAIVGGAVGAAAAGAYCDPNYSDCGGGYYPGAAAGAVVGGAVAAGAYRRGGAVYRGGGARVGHYGGGGVRRR